MSSSSKNQHSAKPSKGALPSVTYSLFLYREELRKRDAHYLRLSKTKICLTDGLISKTVQNITKCTMEELRHLSRGLIFKKKLKHQVQRLRNLEKLGIDNPNPSSLTTSIL